MIMLGRLALAATLATFAFAGAFATASAQYPPPVGNCVVTASATATDEGGAVNLTITVRDLDGNPVAGEPVTLTVTSQPAGGATVTPDASATDAAGILTATLHVGEVPGLVEVTAETADVSCRTTVTVLGGEVEGVIELPETGTGPLADTGVEGAAVLALAAGSVLVSLGLRRRTSCRNA
jgi:hypothetical protein